jgi:hypothetical protein
MFVCRYYDGKDTRKKNTFNDVHQCAIALVKYNVTRLHRRHFRIFYVDVLFAFRLPDLIKTLRCLAEGLFGAVCCVRLT